MAVQLSDSQKVVLVCQVIRFGTKHLALINPVGSVILHFSSLYTQYIEPMVATLQLLSNSLIYPGISHIETLSQ